MDPVGARGQRDVGAVVHQEAHAPRGAALDQATRELRERARVEIPFAKLNQ
jgi:hypothetical protein